MTLTLPTASAILADHCEEQQQVREQVEHALEGPELALHQAHPGPDGLVQLRSAGDRVLLRSGRRGGGGGGRVGGRLGRRRRSGGCVGGTVLPRESDILCQVERGWGRCGSSRGEVARLEGGDQ